MQRPQILLAGLVLALAFACARGGAYQANDPPAETDDGAADASDVDQGDPSDDGSQDDSADEDQSGDDSAALDAGAVTTVDAGKVVADASVTPVVDSGRAAAFSFLASNVDSTAVDLGAAPAATLNCGVTQIDTSGGVTFSNWCGTQPTPLTRAQSGGPELVVIPLSQLTLAVGNTLLITGSRPVAFLVQGAVKISGTIDASAKDGTPGPGGDFECGTSAGGDGAGKTRLNGGGAGGGGFGSAGGAGGDDRGSSSSPGVAGLARGSAALTPLFGGCGGGHGGGCAGVPGAGAGALQISAGAALVVDGVVQVNGGNGAPGCADDSGGTGGGSGGAVLLEADSVDVSAATINAAGGAGGAGQRRGEPGAGATSAASAGGAGQAGGGSGAGAGGGGFGRIQLRAEKTCTGC
jgi:hypothetical protein